MGLHNSEAAISLFENSIEYLSDNGIYIIEDLSISNIQKFQEYISKKDEYVVKYLLMNTKFLSNNNLIVITKNV